MNLSGAIAIALGCNLTDAEIFAGDISEEALKLTEENAELNGIVVKRKNDQVLPGVSGSSVDIYPIPGMDRSMSDKCPTLGVFYFDVFSPAKLAGFDIIVSNPPYVPLGEMTAMDLHVVEYEPETALFVPDQDPLLFYSAIGEFASLNLNRGGQVFVEIHDRYGEETADIFRKWFSNVEIRKDIHGKDRMIRASNG